MAVSRTSKGVVMCGLFLLAIIIDQVIKIEVKTNMCYHESIKVFNWFYISFIENEGMAYGATFINKMALTIFRILAVIVLGYYLFKQVAKGARWVYLVCLTLVMAGALGNLIDCLFYGMVFSESNFSWPSEFVPWGTGYADMGYGRVVDMFYFPLIETTWPDWVPFYGGERFVFFEPIFNFADACISCGVVAVFIFCRKELSSISFSNDDEEKKKEEQAEPTEEGNQEKCE